MRGLKTMRARLVVWFLVIASVPLLVFGALVYRQRSGYLKEEANRKLLAVRDLKVAMIDRWMDEIVNGLQDVSDDSRSRLAPNGNLPLRTDPASLRSAREGLVSYLRFHPNVTEIQIVDARNGKVLVSSAQAQEGEDRSRTKEFTEPLGTRTLFIRDVHRSTADARRMTFSHPMLIPGAGDAVAAVVVADIDLVPLGRLLADRTGLGETGETLIVNRDAVALSDLRWREGAALQMKLSGAVAILAAQGRTGVAEARDYRGIPVLSAYTFIPRPGWGFVAKQDLAELYAPIAVMARTMLILMPLLLGVAALLAGYVAGQLSEPVQAMRATAEEIGKGNRSARNRVDRDDELGLLALAFDKMAGEVESDDTIHHGTGEIMDAMVRPTTVGAFSVELLKVLMRVTGSDLGAFLVPTGDGKLAPAASVGLSGEALEPFDAGLLEGSVGSAVSFRQISHIREIPPDTRFTFRTFTGTAVPREMVTIPVVVGEKVLAVVALASLREYTCEALATVERSAMALGVGFQNVLAGEETLRLAEQLSRKNAELEGQSSELEAQAVELRRQSDVLKEQNSELEVQSVRVAEASRLKGEFLSNMSHELRTPLNSVMALSRVLLMQGRERLAPEEVGYLEIIERNGKHLLSLINDILDLAKIESGRMQVTSEEFSLGEKIRAVVEELEPLAREKRIALVVDLRNDLPHLVTDGRKVHQILQNVIGNAVKFTSAGHVKVSAGRRGDEAVVKVEDTGIGIPRADHERIFEEFRQVDGSASRSYEGTGLGLAISTKAARLLGGRIEVESAPGVGSTFTITLPLAVSGTFPEARPAVEAAPGRGGRLLLVEDSEPAILQIRMVLEEAGYVVDVARGGREALELMRGSPPDGIILDLMMPEVDGFAVLERMRGIPATAETPVLVLTAKDLTPEDRGRLRADKVRQLVQKGDVDRRDLLLEVSRLLGREVESEESGAKQPPVARSVRPERPRRGAGTFPAILVVEDNRDNMTAIRAILDGKFVVHEASDGEEGLRLALSGLPDLILLDISLPRLDGLAVVRRLREHPSTREIPVVALTAHAMLGDGERLLAAGCDDYLPKPVEVEKLLGVVERWLGREGGDRA